MGECFETVVSEGTNLDPFVPNEEPMAIVVGRVEVEVVHQPPRSIGPPNHYTHFKLRIWEFLYFLVLTCGKKERVRWGVSPVLPFSASLDCYVSLRREKVRDLRPDS